MKDKIVQLMRSEGLTSSRLAEILEIQPSGVSHLVSGRNKPGFDLLQKILRRFPNLNPYWLILDDENMYHTATASTAMQDSFDVEFGDAAPINASDLFATLPSSRVGDVPSDRVVASPTHENTYSSNIVQNGARISRVILLYDDGSCQTYSVK